MVRNLLKKLHSKKSRLYKKNQSNKKAREGEENTEKKNSKKLFRKNNHKK